MVYLVIAMAFASIAFYLVCIMVSLVVAMWKEDTPKINVALCKLCGKREAASEPFGGRSPYCYACLTRLMLNQGF